jgi:NAD+ synthase (glutamine-hydrolysing)
MVGGLLLIGDINKVQVYRLAEFLNRRAEGELIPAPVIHRPPSAELADDQVDPFDYPVVAQVVDDVIARKDSSELLKAFEERSLDGRYPQDVYERYDGESFSSMLSETYRRYRKNAFKRAQSSPTVIVSRRALGFDLRETLINRWY